ncbi:hypothetical protein BEP19_09055 [Ammoniphilus oxalaticus]|uniref:Uncharacterized protein n=1 Tax=Ammoniphilus oxalaticus TaxID=66863 RepID=A0A419SKI0_9BACL|nr:hypothetical protein [Ammoniphilus oxalaticus]RKD24521.1 hypothetical protein BEP19_09055 [Ammoniphilus oxalaticus]
MHYFANETIMSIENALVLKPNEITILEHVRTYEYVNDEPAPYFVEIQCLDNKVVVRKNRITDFPAYELEKEESFENIDAATNTFRQWIMEI